MRLLPILAIWLLGLVPAFSALEVKNPRWGFGGKAILGTFNLLSVEVHNPDGKPFEGTLTLRQDDGNGTAAEQAQGIFLAPGTSRWVQFTPYLGNYKPDFVLSWGDGREENLHVEDNRGERLTSPPAVVILADPEMVRTTRIPIFPEALFPATVSATDGLQAVALDHAPRWQPAQREAFLDWVRLGGVVHLLPGPGGALPEFGDELAALNVPGERGRVGAGWVVRHQFPVGEVTTELLTKAGFPPLPDRKDDLQYDRNARYNRFDYDSNSDNSLFRTLAGVTKPKIAWWLIYLLTGVYVVIIGPVFFILRKRDYRYLLFGFLGVVALFAWVFTAVGRRGYGESQVCHSLAVARVLGGGRFEVLHWSHAFATNGDIYRLSYPGPSHLYAVPGGDGEKVRGRVTLGKEAYFDADIPLFSFRNFLHRGVMAGDAFEAKITAPGNGPGADWWKKFQIALGDYPGGEIISAAVQADGRFYRAKISGHELTLSGENGEESSFLREGSSGRDEYGYGYGYYGSAEEAARQLRGEAPILAQRVGGEPRKQGRYLGRVLGDDTVRLYVYAKAPGAFRLSGGQFSAGQNFVLYVQDFALPTRTPHP